MDPNKKLRRSKSDRKLTGVCGGYAKYFGIDSNILRIIFIVAFLCGSLGLWVYLFSWLLIAEENPNDTIDITNQQ